MATGWLDYSAAYAGRPHTVVGDVQVLPGMLSPALGRRMDLLVYLPPSYHESMRRAFPVLLMQDGQNLFDRFTSYAGDWQVDEILESMAVEEGLEAIVVGIPNAGAARLDEYSPWADGRHGGGRARAYLEFVVTTVLPLVRSSFRIVREPEGVVVAGSSMGGLFSLWAFFECPELIGRCAVQSPSVQFAGNALLRDVRHRHYRGGRIYLDAGAREGPPARWGRLLRGLQARPYLRQVRQLRDELIDLGYHREEELRYVEDPDGDHSEQAWSRRLPGALRFLLR